jgi:methyl-accepting chemotaxis protein-1 (serine sensor receptor)
VRQRIPPRPAGGFLPACGVRSRSSSSTAQLVGLLIVGVLFLAAIGLFGVESTHDQGHSALKQAVASSTLLDEARSAQVSFKIQVQDWKNFLLRGHAPADHEKYVAQFGAAEARVNASLDELLASAQLPAALRDEVAAIRAEHTRLGGVYREAMQRFEAAKPESTFAVDASVRGIDQKLTQRIDAVAQQILSAERARVAALQQAFDSRYHTLRLLVIAATIIVLGLLVIVAWRARAR